MGRKRKTGVLDIYVGSSKVGTYSRAVNGSTDFVMTQTWIMSVRVFPISLSMPLSDRKWTGEIANSYFDGLLPDDQTAKDKIATRVQAKGNTATAFLPDRSKKRFAETGHG